MPRLCPRACDGCRDRARDSRWLPCAHTVDHDGRHECSECRAARSVTPATARAAHALDDARAGNPLRLSTP